MVVGTHSDGAQIVISVSVLTGCVRIRTSVEPDACRVYIAEFEELKLISSLSIVREVL